jgi:predicted acylesterase/phospholipase RssA
MKREVSIGITDVLSGEFKDFQEDSFSNDLDLVKVLFASFAVPGFFPPVDAFGSKFFDGSAVYDLDVFTAINKCLSDGNKEEDLVIDIVFTSAANLKQVDAENYKSIGMLFRFLEIASFYSTMDGLLRSKFSFPKANFRYAISPSKTLPSSLYPLVSFHSLKPFKEP